MLDNPHRKYYDERLPLVTLFILIGIDGVLGDHSSLSDRSDPTIPRRFMYCGVRNKTHSMTTDIGRGHRFRIYR